MDDGQSRPADHAHARPALAIPTPLGGRPDRWSPTRRWRRWARRIGLGGLVVAAVLATPAARQHAGTTAIPAPTVAGAAPVTDPRTAPVVSPVTAPRVVSAGELAALPQASTFASVPAAPPDPAPGEIPSGLVVHPAATVAVFAAPGGAPIAALPPQQLGSDTWLPVLSDQRGWVRVALPVRPNGSTGWLFTDDPHITLARTPYRISVDRNTFTLTLTREGREVGRWRVGVGKPGAVTPPGRTFVLAALRDTHPTFSPIVLPLGAHSDTYTSYGGGPGTVALHTWPTSDVFGRASSDGCVRIPPDALAVISTQVPLGTVVLVQ